MFCSNCGNQLSDEAKFCPNCGTKILTAAPEDAVNEETVETVVNEEVVDNAEPQEEAATEEFVNEGTTSEDEPKATAGKRVIFDTSDTAKTSIQFVSIVFGLSFVGIFLSHFFGGIGTTVDGIFSLSLTKILRGVLRFATGAAAGGMGIVYALIVLRWAKEKAKDYFVTLASLGVFAIVVKLIACVLSLLIGGVSWAELSELLGLVVVSIVIFAAVCKGFGISTFEDVDMSNIKETVTDSVMTVYDEAKDELENLKAQSEAKKQAEAIFAAEQDNSGFVSGRPFVPLKTNRSLFMLILLNIVTCGIYGYVFIYQLAEDVNVACEGDGDHTPGLLAFIVLSMVTCGIYGLYWFYKVGNRLQINARRYGMEFPENGTTILLWGILGSFVCGIGSFIATHIIIKNTNLICAAYNKYNMQ